MYLVQALTAARELADVHGPGDGWEELADRLDRLLDVMSTSAPGDRIDVPATAMDRIDRDAIALDEATAERVTSTLTALYDRPDAHRVALAIDVLRDAAPDGS